MGAGHRHDEDEDQAPATPEVRRILAVILVPFMVATVAAVLALWPDAPPPRAPTLAETDYVDATVVRVESTTCGPTIACLAVDVRVEGGPDVGQIRPLPDMTSSPGVPDLEVGDEIVVARVTSDLTDVTSYSFANYQRSKPLWALALVFAVVVVGVARWHGVAALVGLALTWLILVQFVIPAILDGQSPLAVAIAGSSLIMFVLLYLAHGVNARTSTALVGTLVCLALTGLLGWIFVTVTRLTGLGSEEAAFLQTDSITLNLQGLLLASIIIGSLGVLNDVTVTQAAAIWEIHRADPAQPVRRLYGAGMRIGRDHIASTVDTLALAYAGASLPLLILFTLGDQQLGDVISGEIVAEEVVRTLVGSIGLVASVPLTTLLAAAVVVRQSAPPPTPTPDAADRDPATGKPPAAGRIEAARSARRSSWAERRAARSRREESRRRSWSPPRKETDLWDD